MPVTDQFERLALDTITINRDRRQRRQVDTKGLLESIRAHGVMHPVVVQRGGAPDGRHLLVTGERRYTACQELGLPDVIARFTDDLTPIELQILELDENVKRQDLEWQEIVRGTAHIHQLYCQLDPGWTMGETAEAIGLSLSTVSLYLTVFTSMDEERVHTSGTVREAYNLLKRRDQRAAGEALQEILDTVNGPQLAEAGEPQVSNLVLLPSGTSGSGSALAGSPAVTQKDLVPRRLFPDPQKCILQESFLQWAPRYEGKKFNLIHCDFPYGVNLFSANGLTSGPSRSQMGQQGTVYDDSREIYFALLECLCRNLERFTSVSAHLMFWFSEKHRDATLRAFADLAPTWKFAPFPLIWHKTDNAGIASDVRHHPRHVYETCLLATRGERQIAKVVSDCYGAPTDKRLHPSAKPEPMLRHFMSMLVDEHTQLLDPTCGSASSLRAAESLGASRLLGMDIDDQTVGSARLALKQSRSLRGTGGL